MYFFITLPHTTHSHTHTHYILTHTHAIIVDSSICGIEVIGETEITVPNDGGTLEWKGYGLKLHVPEHSCSLQANSEECRIIIRASLSGAFKLPDDTELLSPIFWMSVADGQKFLKPVTLEIQHCASRHEIEDEDESSLADLSFMSAESFAEVGHLPYIFKALEGGVFTDYSSYGSIQLTQLSGVGVAGCKATPCCYRAHVYRTNTGVRDWRFYFVVTRDLEAQRKVRYRLESFLKPFTKLKNCSCTIRESMFMLHALFRVDCRDP